MSRLFAWLVALWAALRSARAPEPEDGAPASPAGGGDDPDDVSERTVPANRRAETLVAGLLVAAAVLAFAFTVVYVIAGFNTQLLGICFGGALLLAASAAIIAGKAVVPQETSVEEREPLLQPDPMQDVAEMAAEGGEGISRRILLLGAGGIAGAGLLTAAATPIASLGPRLTGIHKTPWHRGVYLVDESGSRYNASDIEAGTFYTALPEGGPEESFGAGVLVVKLPKRWLRLPRRRQAWAPQGIVAYSKICTHAGCAVSLYRYPTFERPDEPPAFTCPCHYSTFLPGEGCKVAFGPAGRPLPQLPIALDSDGYLVAAGGFDGDIGPAWWGTDRV